MPEILGFGGEHIAGWPVDKFLHLGYKIGKNQLLHIP